jgi:NAD-dependent DNA ligase
MQEIVELTKKLLDASNKYYNGGNSPLTDKEFDELLDKLKVMEETYHFRLSNSPTINV